MGNHVVPLTAHWRLNNRLAIERYDNADLNLSKLIGGSQTETKLKTSDCGSKRLNFTVTYRGSQLRSIGCELLIIHTKNETATCYLSCFQRLVAGWLCRMNQISYYRQHMILCSEVLIKSVYSRFWRNVISLNNRVSHRWCVNAVQNQHYFAHHMILPSNKNFPNYHVTQRGLGNMRWSVIFPQTAHCFCSESSSCC